MKEEDDIRGYHEPDDRPQSMKDLAEKLKLEKQIEQDELTRLRSELQQKDEWISVKDRLPNENQLVLIYHEQEYFIGWLEFVYSDGSATFKEIGGVYNIPATHWKSIEPPKSKAK